MKSVFGTDKVLSNIAARMGGIYAKAAEAVEKSAVDVSNHAKDGHAGNMAHANKRYQNQTTNLTRSITPSLSKVTKKVIEAEVSANTDYAERIESVYPYMFPALLANQRKFIERMKGVLL